MRHSIFPPSSISQVVSQVEEIDQNSYLALHDAITGRHSFSLSTTANQKLSSDTGIPENTLSYITAALAFIYERLPTSKDDIEARRRAIEDVVQDLGLFREEETKKNLLIDRLDTLLTYNPNHERLKKNRRLEAGFLSNIVEINSFVDIRPSFTKERDGIDGYIPVVQINIVTDSDDPSISSLTFQITPRALQDLREKIEDIEKKIQAVRSQGAFATLLLDERD